MQDGDQQPAPRAQPDVPMHDDDPVIAFLFEQELDPAAPDRPPAARPGAHASRSISRLRNNRGALYLPTLDPAGGAG